MDHDDRDLENASDADHDEAIVKPGGLGEDGTIPPDPDGVAANSRSKANTRSGVTTCAGCAPSA